MNFTPKVEVLTGESRALYIARLRRVFVVTGMLSLLLGIACVFGFKRYLRQIGGVDFGDMGDLFLNGAIVAMGLGLVSILFIQVCCRIR